MEIFQRARQGTARQVKTTWASGGVGTQIAPPCHGTDENEPIKDAIPLPRPSLFLPSFQAVHSSRVLASRPFRPAAGTSSPAPAPAVPTPHQHCFFGSPASRLALAAIQSNHSSHCRHLCCSQAQGNARLRSRRGATKRPSPNQLTSLLSARPTTHNSRLSSRYWLPCALITLQALDSCTTQPGPAVVGLLAPKANSQPPQTPSL